MSERIDRPAAGSHDRTVPTGSLEVSASTLFEAMVAARDSDDPSLLAAFYRAVMSSTLLLPVPPGAGEETKAVLERAVSDEEEVEVGVMLARDADGNPTSIVFGSPAALAAWAPVGTTSLPLPARIAVANLAAAGLPAVLDPAGPIPYRFEREELAALAAGRLPGSEEPLLAATARGSLRLRLPGPEGEEIERRAREALRGSDVEAAYLVESLDAGGRRFLLGFVGDGLPASVLAALPREVDVVALEEPLLGNVRAVSEPFYVGQRR
jgi:hypothetical protein